MVLRLGTLAIGNIELCPRMTIYDDSIGTLQQQEMKMSLHLVITEL